LSWRVSAEPRVSIVKEVSVVDIGRGSSSSHSNFSWRRESNLREAIVRGGDRVERMTAVSNEGNKLRYASMG
jgi:hypothetical protein